MNTSTRARPAGSDLPALRARVDGQTGPRYWRSLEELAETEEFTALPPPRVPRAGVGVDRPGQPPRASSG